MTDQRVKITNGRKGLLGKVRKKIPPADQPQPFLLRELISADMQYLIGKTFGRLTVQGLSAAKNGMWSVRCTCGTYTLRKARAITNPSNNHDCCQTCRQQMYSKPTV